MTLDEQAMALYLAYPRKVARAAALRAIRKALIGEPFDLLLDAVQEYADARNGQDSQFTPHPSTWFNQERWADDRSDWWQGRKPEVSAEDAFEKVRQAISRFGRGDPKGAREWLRDVAITSAVKDIGWSNLCNMDDFSRTAIFNRFRILYEEGAIRVRRSQNGDEVEGEGPRGTPRPTIPIEAARKKA
tara:strand:+ start:453 stop:1016 length:564 start_codon:yes stop_codon:yes gene_type:complete